MLAPLTLTPNLKMKREKKTNNFHFSSGYTFMYNVVNILMPYQPHILPTCLTLTEHSRCNTACNSPQYHRPSIEILHHPCPAPPNEKPLLLSGELLLIIWLAGPADVGGLHSWIEQGGVMLGGALLLSPGVSIPPTAHPTSSCSRSWVWVVCHPHCH